MHCDVALFYHRRLSPYTTVYTHCVCMCVHTSSFHYPSPRSIPFDHSEIVVHLVARPSLLYIHPSCPTTGYTLCPRPFVDPIPIFVDRSGWPLIHSCFQRSSVFRRDRLGKATPFGSFADIRRPSRGPLLFSKFPNFRIFQEPLVSPFFLKKTDMGELSLFFLSSTACSRISHVRNVV